MPRFHTVIPLHHVGLDLQGHCDFANGFILVALPDWARRQDIVGRLSKSDQRELEQITHCVMTTYEAAPLGDLDPTWTASIPESTQETKYEEGVLANLALWISRPSPAGFILVLHATQGDGDPVVQEVVRYSPLLCHPQDRDTRVAAEEVERAAAFHRSLVAVNRDTAVWTAVRAAWAGLEMHNESIRHVLFWIALEALFGPEDAREITYRLAQRVAFFLANEQTPARQVFDTAKRGYRFRSKTVHGRWNEDADSEKRMAEAEDLVRQSLVRILEDARLTEVFSGKAREGFLDDLTFGGGSTA